VLEYRSIGVLVTRTTHTPSLQYSISYRSSATTFHSL
jgi:hypothetical protein